MYVAKDRHSDPETSVGIFSRSAEAWRDDPATNPTAFSLLVHRHLGSQTCQACCLERGLRPSCQRTDSPARRLAELRSDRICPFSRRAAADDRPPACSPGDEFLARFHSKISGRKGDAAATDCRWAQIQCVTDCARLCGSSGKPICDGATTDGQSRQCSNRSAKLV